MSTAKSNDANHPSAKTSTEPRASRPAEAAVPPPAAQSESTELEYFRRIEDRFIELRGAPLYLSPSDYQVAKRWWSAGIPVDIVERALAEVFERRRERGNARRAVSSLAYCSSAVEQAWAEVRELTAANYRRSEVSRASTESETRLTSEQRLRFLAAALPEQLPDRRRFVESIEALVEKESPEVIEQELERLDSELLRHVEKSLEEKERTGLEQALQRTLSRLAPRMDREELERARERLRRQLLRQQLALPVLSLFSPEAERDPSSV